MSALADIGPGPGPATGPRTVVPALRAGMREAALLALERKLQRRARRDRHVPPRWLRPMIWARPILDVLGSVAVGYLAANVALLAVFVFVNMLLHL